MSIEAIGGFPVPTEEFASRASKYVLNPQRNPVKEILDQYDDILKAPPLLGIFNDIPCHKLREDEVHSWARAGFSFVINDGEHNVYEGRYGSEQNAMMLRLGITPIQRLHREAISEHGDALMKGARGTMRPYATTLEEAQVYFQSLNYPVSGSANSYNRGGYPVRGGDRVMKFTPDQLRHAERDTQGWLQFETGEYIKKENLRDQVLELIASQGKNKACVFIGPFDSIMREGASPEIIESLDELAREGSQRGIPIGRVVGPSPGYGGGDAAKDLEDNLFKAIQNGNRLISIHFVTSDLPYYGAFSIGEIFFRACKRAGF